MLKAKCRPSAVISSSLRVMICNGYGGEANDFASSDLAHLKKSISWEKDISLDEIADELIKRKKKWKDIMIKKIFFQK